MSDVVVAIDVTGGPVEQTRRAPRNADLAFGAIADHAEGDHRPDARKRVPPTSSLRREVDRFRVLEFFRADEIIEAARPAADELREKLNQALQHRSLMPRGPCAGAQMR